MQVNFSQKFLGVIGTGNMKRYWNGTRKLFNNKAMRLHQYTYQIYGFKFSFRPLGDHQDNGHVVLSFLVLVQPPGGTLRAVFHSTSVDPLTNSGMCFYSFMTCDWLFFEFEVKMKARQRSTVVEIDEWRRREIHVNYSFVLKTILPWHITT